MAKPILKLKTQSNKTLVAPKLVKLQKKGGEIVHPYDIYIGRYINNPSWQLTESIWHNPYRMPSNIRDRELLEKYRADIIEKYRDHLLNNEELLTQLPNLSGLTLGCWCSPLGCHGDVIIDLFKKIVLKEN